MSDDKSIKIGGVENSELLGEDKDRRIIDLYEVGQALLFYMTKGQHKPPREKTALMKIQFEGLDIQGTYKEVLDLLQKLNVVHPVPKPRFDFCSNTVLARSPISKSPVYVALLDVVLWCFRPRSLTLKLGPSINKRDVVEFTYEKLLQQEEEGQTNIKFVLTSYYVREQQFTDLNSLLKALSLGLSSCKITFIKEEVSYMGINACTSEILGIADTKTVVRAVQLTEENLTVISGNGKKEIDQREVKAKDGVDHGIEHMLRMSNNPIPERAKFGGLTETMNNLKEEVKNNLEKTRSKEEEGKRNPKKLKGVLCFMCIIIPVFFFMISKYLFL